MHTFQPYPIDMLNMNPFTKIGKEWALISAGDKNKCNTMTVSWGGVGVLWGCLLYTSPSPRDTR